MANDITRPALPTPDESLAGIMGTVKVAYYSSFPIDTPMAKSAAFAALQGDSLEIKGVINVPLEVWGYLVRPSDPKISQDGEIQVYPISIILCSGGTAYRSGSKGILQSLRLFEAELGLGPWQPAISCTPRLRNLDGGKNWLYLSRSQTKQE